MRHVMRNMRKLKVKCYAAHTINLIEYLAAFSGEKASETIGEIELSEISLNSMPNGQR